MADSPARSVTSAQLAKRVGKTADDDEVQHALAVAQDMVEEATAQAFRTVPASIVKECVLSVGHAVYDRTKSSGGIGQQIAMEGGSPVRAPRDPKATIRHILADYVLGMA